MKKIKIAIVGFGNIGSFLFNELKNKNIIIFSIISSLGHITIITEKLYLSTDLRHFGNLISW